MKDMIVSRIKTDLTLIHPPSVYDFRKKSIMFGPISDLVPSLPILDMYPIGFLTIANYLSKRKFRVRIVNLAYRMYDNIKFDVEKFIKKLNTLTFGIDLHWLPHCQGSLEVAKVIKKYHPDTPVIFGGLSASYFCRELIEYPQVDYIVRGYSTESYLYHLLYAIKNNKLNRLDNIPNLVWKKNNKICVNKLDTSLGCSEQIDFDYRIMFKQVIKYRDIKSVLPFYGWLKYPITIIPIVRGCNKNCPECGGSNYSCRKFFGKSKPVFRDPEKVVKEIEGVHEFIKGPIFILGDINQNGKEYVLEFFNRAKTLDKNIQIFLEFFDPPQKWFFDKAASVFNNICYEISPNSHDERIRKLLSKHYSNEELVGSIRYALKKGAKRFDVYFLTGLPFQNKKSIIKTISFCKKIYEKVNWDRRFSPFISPLAPFLDPGSRIFESPRRFGYKLLRKNLKEHIEAMTEPFWKYTLNYENRSITKEDLVNATYRAAMGLNKLKVKAGTISKQMAWKNEMRIKKTLTIIKEIDLAEKQDDSNPRNGKLTKQKDEIFNYSISTVCNKEELEFPLASRNFNWFKILRALFTTN